MTQREKQLVRTSFQEIREVAIPVARLFYGRLLDLEPSLRPMFREDFQKQSAKLIDMLTAVVDNIEDLEKLNPVLREMGLRHAGYGVLPRHYVLVEKALLWALAHALESGFHAEVRAAWQGVLARVSGAMLAGVAHRDMVQER